MKTAARCASCGSKWTTDPDNDFCCSAPLYESPDDCPDMDHLCIGCKECVAKKCRGFADHHPDCQFDRLKLSHLS